MRVEGFGQGWRGLGKSCFRGSAAHFGQVGRSRAIFKNVTVIYGDPHRTPATLPCARGRMVVAQSSLRSLDAKHKDAQRICPWDGVVAAMASSFVFGLPCENENQ